MGEAEVYETHNEENIVLNNVNVMPGQSLLLVVTYTPGGVMQVVQSRCTNRCFYFNVIPSLKGDAGAEVREICYLGYSRGGKEGSRHGHPNERNTQ